MLTIFHLVLAGAGLLCGIVLFGLALVVQMDVATITDCTPQELQTYREQAPHGVVIGLVGAVLCAGVLMALGA